MQDLAELEHRISLALERIGRGLDGLAGREAEEQIAVDMAAERAAILGAELNDAKRALAEALAAQSAAHEADPAALAALQDELATLRGALDAERARSSELSIQLAEHQRALRERDAALGEQSHDKVERLTRQLDVQGLELQRMRRTSIALREQLRQLREATAAGLTEPHLINKAMLNELEALRATRLTEMAELDEIAAALDDHLTEAEHA